MAVVAVRATDVLPWTSGNSLLNLSTYLNEHYDTGAFARVLGELRVDQANALSGIILPQRHYPTEAYVAAVEVASSLYDPERLPEHYGEWAASFTIHGLFRFLLRFSEPTWVVARGTRIWRAFHSTGEWETEIAEGIFRGALSDFAIVSAR